MYTVYGTVLGLAVPLLGTALGAAAALFLRRKLPAALEKAMLGFAAGVMLAASVWSLLLPAIAYREEQGLSAWPPAALGFLLGAGGMLWLRRCMAAGRRRGGSGEGEREFFLAFSVTLHNIPEGMAVGVAFASALGAGEAAMAGAFALALGIGIQNIPEGGIISLPLALGGMDRGRAFSLGVLSGAVEPLFALLALLLTALVRPILPWVLAVAAGCMFFVVAEELLPASEDGENGATGAAGASVGFALMMLLDVALG
ncbi:MAG: ZIP family metal transporter [Oscillospiraceae bacterium]